MYKRVHVTVDKEKLYSTSNCSKNKKYFRILDENSKRMWAKEGKNKTKQRV